MSQDFQKQEAKQCLWDQDGIHTGKRWRNRGKGRGKDKALIREQLNYDKEKDIERELRWDEEVEEAFYCLDYGPCERCVSREEKRFIWEIVELQP